MKKLTVVVCHNDSMGVASCDLNGLVLVEFTTLKLKLPRRQLRVLMTMAKLTILVPAPSVDFT